MDLHFVPVSEKCAKIYHIIFNVGIRFFMISSIFMLLAISRVRLLAIRKPFQHNSSIVSGKERRRYWLRYLVPITFLSMTLTLPLLLELDCMAKANEDSDSKRMLPSQPQLNLLYATLFSGFLNLVIVGVMPMICLCYLAYQTRLELKNRGRRIRSISACQRNQEAMQEDKTARTLVTIILTFITLHSLRMIWNFVEIYVLLNLNKIDAIKHIDLVRSNWCYVIASLSKLFMVINSTVNVIIYLYSNVQKISGICLANEAKPIRHSHMKRASTIDTDTTNRDSLVINTEFLTTPAADKDEHWQSKMSNDEVINV